MISAPSESPASLQSEGHSPIMGPVMTEMDPEECVEEQYKVWVLLPLAVQASSHLAVRCPSTYHGACHHRGGPEGEELWKVLLPLSTESFLPLAGYKSTQYDRPMKS